MVRSRKERPKRYKSYLKAYGEASDEPIDIPESTLRSQRKRRLHEDSISSSTSDSEAESLQQDTEVENQQQDTEALDQSLDNPESVLRSQKRRRLHEDPSSSSTSDVSEGAESVNRWPPLSDQSDADIQENSGDESASSQTNGEDEQFQCDDSDTEISVKSNDKGSTVSQRNALHDTSDTSRVGDKQSVNGSYEESSCGGSSSESGHESSDEGSTLSQTNALQLHFSDTSEQDEDEHSVNGSRDDSSVEGSIHTQIGENETNESEHEDGNDNTPVDLYMDLKLKLQGNFQDPLNVTVTASVGEILTNILTLVKKHNWNHSEKEDLAKFANSLLNKECVPSTRFLLDKYLFSKAGMRYQFFCSDCTQFLLDVKAAEHTQTQIICSNNKCSKLNVISDLSKATYFVTFDIPSQLNLLLEDANIRKKLLNPLDFIEEPVDSIMRDLHHGSAYRSFANYVHQLPNPRMVRYMSLSLSVDSAALCSGFSKQSICPVFIMINELPQVLRMKHLLIGGLWFGLKKEKMHLLLPPIVKHIISLSTSEFSMQFQAEVWLVKAYLIACVADSVARCDVQGIHAHRGDYPCSWCLIEGMEYMGSRIFPYDKDLPPPRTIQGMLEDSRKAKATKVFVRGVKYMCLLSAAPLFHPVEGFVVDQMHAKDEGTTKAFLNSWLGEDGKTPYYIGAENKRKLDSLLKQVKTPQELRKNVRSLDHLSYWTGREMENWCFFLSLPLLHDLLPNRYLKHWALYVQGTYLLLSSEINPAVVDIAEALLEEFCSHTEDLYGPHMMRFNLHILRHFGQNCRRWGPLFALSAYAFEKGNKDLKDKVHDCNGIPNQVCRGISEDNALLILKSACDTAMTRAFQKSIEPKSHATRSRSVGDFELRGVPKTFKPSREEKWLVNQKGVNAEDCVVYNQLKKDGCSYGPFKAAVRQVKNDNSFAKLKNNNFVRIQKIIHCERSNDVMILGQRLRCEPSRFCPPSVVRYDSSLCCLFDVTSVDEDLIVIDVSELQTVCVHTQSEHGQFITAMPNIFNMY